MNANERDIIGNTPLALASKEGHLLMVQLYLTHEEVDVNAKGSRGKTPMHWAARFGHLEIVKLLLSTKRVDVSTKDSDGFTPLSLASLFNKKGVVDYLKSEECLSWYYLPEDEAKVENEEDVSPLDV